AEKVACILCQEFRRQLGRSLPEKHILVLRLFMRRQQRFDLDAQILLARACLSDEFPAFIGWPLEGQRHQLIDPAKSLWGHSLCPGPRSRHSHALAFSHSRLTVLIETAMTSATSSIPRPPKYLNSTIWLFRGSNSQRRFKASSMAKTSSSGCSEVRFASVRDTRTGLAPRLA